ncbi:MULTISPECIES: putative 2OG-Fe(II) oxygenase [unclassified Pseudoalteromonas]|uniref:putative 2OG-Fe(II) oxygenase n=1 Tax=unclassified Pseudoalteromonas TaxID=194690 RepID=UPI0019CF92B2|nr:MULTISPECIES: putative 2OG-Fe(II) oxygenase [unclassified Pseudoalteromonas]MBR8845240.1 2OG-Fe(II) oxygenase [Pseudoalteromonas sp. JC3]QUI71705.1 hypothetical protein GSF13_19050 [Pseudoalteromonas sp. M8]WJE07886.1 putative 2OG-Fe(II) oxygenase [Pseudoalteromonas sp. JC3]
MFINAQVNFDTNFDYLIDEIYKEKEIGLLIERSNQGGWHSEYKLHLSKNKAFMSISKEISEISNFILKNKKKVNHTLELKQMWANINKSGDWNSPHNHLDSKNENAKPGWSGVLYLNIEESKMDSGGDLILFFINEKNIVDRYFHKPKQNQMILFSSDTLHMVTPNKSNEDRISIAFNLV